ncbi:MAG: BF3164 family lipoprotein [Rikenellaceae bacterium]|nr:BF3164 family lipoprotein [Rikenellaceae bacterium]
MRKQFVNICLLLVTLIACKQESHKYLNPSDVFGVTDTLRATILPEPLMTNNVISRIYHTPKGLILNTQIDKYVIQLIDTTTGKRLASAGRIGRGPDELINPSGMSYNYDSGSYFVWDYNLSRLEMFAITDSIVKKRSMSNIKLTLQTLDAITDTTFAALDFCPDQSIGIVDTNGRYLSKLPYKIINDKSIDYKVHYFNTNMDLSLDKQYMVASCSQLPHLSLYSIKDNKLSKVWEKMIFKPKYKLTNSWIKIDNEQLSGFSGPIIRNQCIYLCSHGLTKGEWIKEDKTGRKTNHTYILVFNLKGEFVRSYVMDKYFIVYAVSPDGRTLYAVIDDPDLYIAKYSLYEK